ncbi:ethanolamine permease [Haliea sp.]
MSNGKVIHKHGADYETPEAGYFKTRELRRGAASWVLLAALGVSYVIAGEFAAWNYGIDQAGWGGMFISLLLMALMYFCLVFSLAELASIIPTAGGGYGFARRAFGPGLGFLTGIAIVFEYGLATAAVALFFEGYFKALTGWGGLAVLVPLFGVFFLIHIRGARESLRVILILAAIAGAGILVFIVMMAPKIQLSNLFDIPATAATGASAVLPYGYAGIWAGLPFAIAMFLAVEGIPLASEEAKDPTRDVPRGMITAIVILFTLAVFILLSAPGGAGSSRLGEGEDPLMIAFTHVYGPEHPLRYIINIAALVGITASFFSLIFAYSRQVFSLSRAGYLPRFLSLTNRRKAPYMAVLVPGAIAFGLSLTRAAEQLIVIVVFCATLSYVIMMASHIKLRLQEPALPRPYRTPGGITAPLTALALSLLAFAVCLTMSVTWSLAAVAGLAIAGSYYWIYSRHHLIAQAPEEEFETMQEANAELDD